MLTVSASGVADLHQIEEESPKEKRRIEDRSHCRASKCVAAIRALHGLPDCRNNALIVVDGDIQHPAGSNGHLGIEDGTPELIRVVQDTPRVTHVELSEALNVSAIEHRPLSD